MRLDARIDLREGADRARDCAGGDLAARRDETVLVAREPRLGLRELLAARELGLDLDALFDLSYYTRYAERIVGRLDAIPELAPAAA